jgi:hypothetical protein
MRRHAHRIGRSALASLALQPQHAANRDDCGCCIAGPDSLGIDRNLRAAKRDNHPLMRPLKIEATTDAMHPDYNNAVSSHIRTTCNLPVRKEEF